MWFPNSIARFQKMDAFDNILAGIQKDKSPARKDNSKINRALLADYCPNCGAPTNDVICEYCDSQIPAKKLEVPSVNAVPSARAYDEIFCQSCGELIKAVAEFCPKCGVRQRTQEIVEYYEDDDNDNTATAVAGAAAGFVAGAVAKKVASEFIDNFFG